MLSMLSLREMVEGHGRGRRGTGLAERRPLLLQAAITPIKDKDHFYCYGSYIDLIICRPTSYYPMRVIFNSGADVDLVVFTAGLRADVGAQGFV